MHDKQFSVLTRRDFIRRAACAAVGTVAMTSTIRDLRFMNAAVAQSNIPAGDYKALDLLPRNASPVRLHNRCQLTGRPRGYIRYFGISRVIFRDMALQGKIPGVRKASW